MLTGVLSSGYSLVFLNREIFIGKVWRTILGSVRPISIGRLIVEGEARTLREQ